MIYNVAAPSGTSSLISYTKKGEVGFVMFDIRAGKDSGYFECWDKVEDRMENICWKRRWMSN